MTLGLRMTLDNWLLRLQLTLFSENKIAYMFGRKIERQSSHERLEGLVPASLEAIKETNKYLQKFTITSMVAYSM